jgi:glutamine cyclotransferase
VIFVNRLPRLYVILSLVLLALLGAVLISYCATRPKMSESATTTSATSPTPTSPLEIVTVPSKSDNSDNVTSSVPTSSTDALTPEAVPVYTYKTINTYPHDPNAYTQGLVFEDGILYEGTGLRGRSTLRKVVLETGDVWQLYALPAQFFGEGVTVFGDRIIQLTWQSNVGFVYDKNSFALLQEFHYPTEGWGLTHDGERLIMSDGTPTLHFLDPETLEEIGRIEVYDQDSPVPKLNELEYIQGEIYANVWQTDRIARIDPHTGQVVGWIDLSGLLSPEDYSQPLDVLNGIAYDSKNDRLFVTGKLWPKLFEIELVNP